MATVQLSEGNSSYVQITLTNPLDSTAINDAVVTGQIVNYDDSEAVASFSMPYVAASAGIYRAAVAPDVDIINGKTYKVVIDSTGPGALVGHFECSVTAAKIGC